MQILQVHYTSCPNGTSGHKGFQVRAMSAEVDASDLRDIISRGGYNEHRRLTPEEITTLPVAYRSYLLSSGRIALTRIRYVGEDYIPSVPKRHGNYFAHTLIFPLDAMTQRPIDYWYWQDWKEKLEDDEINLPPPVLPSISINELITPKYLSVKDRLITDEKSKIRLRLMIKSLFMGQFDSCRKLIIRGNPKDNVLWITALQNCFPISIAKSINSSTYEQNLNTASFLTATTENSGVILTDTDKNYYYYVFDNYTGIDSDISADSKWDIIDAYAKLVTHILIEQPDKLENFFLFIDGLGIKKLDKNTANALGIAACIYSLSIPELHTNYEIYLADLVNYALTIPPEYPAWQLMANNLNSLEHLIEDELHIKLLIVESLATSSNIYLEKAITLWRDMWLKETSENRIPSGTINTIRLYIIDKIPTSSIDIAEKLLDKYTINQATKTLQVCSPKVAQYIVDEISRTLTAIKRVPVLEQVETQELLTALQRNPIAYDAIMPITLSLAETVNAFVSICYSAGITNNIDKSRLTQLTELFFTQLRNRDEYFSQQVRQLVPIDILISEWTYIVKCSKNRIEDYLKYREYILSIRKDIKFYDYADLTAQLINTTNAPELQEIAKFLFTYNEIKLLSEKYPEIAANLLKNLNDSVSLVADGNTREVIDGLPELASSMYITLKPNRVLLHRMLADAANKEANFPMQDLIKLHGDLIALTDKDYCYAREKILASCVLDKRRFISVDHLQVILNLNKPNIKQISNDKHQSTEFQKYYLKLLSNTVTHYSLEEIRIYTAIWVKLNRENDKDGILFSMFDEIIKILANAIANHFRIEKKYSNYNYELVFFDKLKNNTEPNNETTMKRIENLKILVNDSNKGISDHFFTFLSKYF